MTPRHYRKKPVIIEAVQLDPDGDRAQWAEVIRWCHAVPLPGTGAMGTPVCAIDTLEGQLVAMAGDWIIRGIKGEYYPCKPDIFAATYEEV